MITKQQLKGYRSLVREIVDLDAELNSLYGVRERKTSESHGGNTVTDLSSTIIRMIELEELIKMKRDKLVAERTEIEKFIDILPPYERLVIRHRYIQGFSWVQIQMRLEMSESSVHRLHGQSLRRLALRNGESMEKN